MCLSGQHFPGATWIASGPYSLQQLNEIFPSAQCTRDVSGCAMVDRYVIPNGNWPAHPPLRPSPGGG